MNEKLNEILSDVWHRSISADEGFDAICDLIEQSAEIAGLEAELAECRKDAERYRYWRDKLIAADFSYQDSDECVIILSSPNNIQYSPSMDFITDQAIEAMKGE